MEEASEARLRELLPSSWWLHDYAPDYGIDKVIELFEAVPDQPGTSETLGQHLMIQLKSELSCTESVITVHERGNVAKPPTLFAVGGARAEIPVIRYSIDTNTLATVARMGSAVPVILILVCLETGRTFFVCLNDLVDKVLDPEEPGWRRQDTKTISIPVRNEITDDPLGIGLTHLRFYSRRGKFHGLFNLVAYQFHEMQFLRELPDARATVLGWAHQLLSLDIWDTHEWMIIVDYAAELDAFVRLAVDRNYRDEIVFDQAYELWRRLDVLSRNFEELCREWCMPTLLAQSLSYPG